MTDEINNLKAWDAAIHHALMPVDSPKNTNPSNQVTKGKILLIYTIWAYVNSLLYYIFVTCSILDYINILPVSCTLTIFLLFWVLRNAILLLCYFMCQNYPHHLSLFDSCVLYGVCELK